MSYYRAHYRGDKLGDKLGLNTSSSKNKKTWFTYVDKDGSIQRKAVSTKDIKDKWEKGLPIEGGIQSRRARFYPDGRVFFYRSGTVQNWATGDIIQENEEYRKQKKRERVIKGVEGTAAAVGTAFLNLVTLGAAGLIEVPLLASLGIGGAVAAAETGAVAAAEVGGAVAAAEVGGAVAALETTEAALLGADAALGAAETGLETGVEIAEAGMEIGEGVIPEIGEEMELVGDGYVEGEYIPEIGEGGELLDTYPEIADEGAMSDSYAWWQTGEEAIGEGTEAAEGRSAFLQAKDSAREIYRLGHKYGLPFWAIYEQWKTFAKHAKKGDWESADAAIDIGFSVTSTLGSTALANRVASPALKSAIQTGFIVGGSTGSATVKSMWHQYKEDGKVHYKVLQREAAAAAGQAGVMVIGNALDDTVTGGLFEKQVEQAGQKTHDVIKESLGGDKDFEPETKPASEPDEEVDVSVQEQDPRVDFRRPAEYHYSTSAKNLSKAPYRSTTRRF